MKIKRKSTTTTTTTTTKSVSSSRAVSDSVAGDGPAENMHDKVVDGLTSTESNATQSDVQRQTDNATISEPTKSADRRPVVCRRRKTGTKKTASTAKTGCAGWNKTSRRSAMKQRSVGVDGTSELRLTGLNDMDQFTEPASSTMTELVQVTTASSRVQGTGSAVCDGQLTATDASLASQRTTVTDPYRFDTELPTSLAHASRYQHNHAPVYSLYALN